MGGVSSIERKVYLEVRVAVTAPGRCCYCLNQASLTIRTKGRAGKLPVGGKTNRSQTATDVVIVIK